MKRRIVFIVSLLTVLFARAQDSIMIPILGVNIGGHIPAGDLQTRFGSNLKAGFSFLVKTKKNLLFGIEYNYLFGSNVKEDVLVQLRNENGTITNNEGYPADIRVTQRGSLLHLTAGYLVKVSHKNSGVLAMVGGGIMQHKINIYDDQRKIAAINGENIYGYDRLTLGPSASAFLGYLHLSQNRLTNFYVGFELYYGSTRSVRGVNYDNQQADNRTRQDLLYGARFGWILPLYKKKPNEFYYN